MDVRVSMLRLTARKDQQRVWSVQDPSPLIVCVRELMDREGSGNMSMSVLTDATE